MVPESDGVARHRINPLFRIEALKEDVEIVYQESIPQFKIAYNSKNS